MVRDEKQQKNNNNNERIRCAKPGHEQHGKIIAWHYFSSSFSIFVFSVARPRRPIARFPTGLYPHSVKPFLIGTLKPQSVDVIQFPVPFIGVVLAPQRTVHTAVHTLKLRTVFK